MAVTVTPDPGLVVSVEDVVKGLPGMTYADLDDDQYEVIEEAILDAQDDVRAYLGRPLMPVQHVATGRWPYPGGWDVDTGDEPTEYLTVVSADPETDENGQGTGYFTVTYLLGMNAKTDPDARPIRRFVKAHATNSPTIVALWADATKAKGTVKSLTAEGQSVSFEKPNLGVTGQKPGDKTPGSLPTMASLDYWRLAGRRVHQGPSRTSDWPYTGRRW